MKQLLFSLSVIASNTSVCFIASQQKDLAQCLASSNSSVNICWVNEWMFSHLLLPDAVLVGILPLSTSLLPRERWFCQSFQFQFSDNVLGLGLWKLHFCSYPFCAHSQLPVPFPCFLQNERVLLPSVLFFYCLVGGSGVSRIPKQDCLVPKFFSNYHDSSFIERLQFCYSPGSTLPACL